MAITLSDLKRELKPWILSLVTGGGGGTYAPINAPYLTVGADATLTAERAIVAGSYLDYVDGGANSTYTLNVVVDADFQLNNYSLTEVGTLQFNNLYSTTGLEPVGSMFWNSVDGTVDIRLYNNATLQTGQELHFYGKASGNILNGELCQFAGVQGDHILIKKVVAAEIIANPEYLVGVATQNINNGVFGYVTWFGKVNGVYTDTPANNDSADWVEGDLLYFSNTTGQLTKTEPTAPARKIIMAAVIKVQTGSSENGIILIRPTFGMKLSDLDDVTNGATPDTNSVLTYNGTTWGESAYQITSGGSDYTLTIPATGTAAIGAGAAGRVTYWSDANTLTSSEYLTYAPGLFTTASQSGVSTTSGINIDGYAVTPLIRIRRAQGTMAIPTAISAANQTIGQLNYQAYSGSAYRASATIQVVSAEAHSATAGGVNWTMSATRIGATSAVTVVGVGGNGVFISDGSASKSAATLDAIPSALNIGVSSSLTDTVKDLITIDHNSTGTAAAGFGSEIMFRLESSTTNDQAAGALWAKWQTATHASRAASVGLSAYYTTNERQAITATATSAGAITKIEFAQQGTYTTTAVNLTLSTAHHWVVVTAACTITLPAAATYSGQEYIISALANGVIIDPAGTETIDGDLTARLRKYETLQIKSNGSNWIAI